MILKCCLVLFTLGHPDLVESSAKVKLRKPFGTGKFIEWLVDNRYRKLAHYCHGIEAYVIHAKALGAVFFLDEQGW